MDYIKKEVSRLVKKHHTKNPFELADAMGMIYNIIPMQGRVNGFYTYFQRTKIIVINALLPKERQIEVCAHEICHGIYDVKTNCKFIENHTYFSKDKYEIRANTFAAELLIENDIFENYKGYTLDQIAAIENISKYLLELKFQNLYK